MQAHAAACHAAFMIKAELDGLDFLIVKEWEASLAVLETATTLEGELKETRTEIKA